MLKSESQKFIDQGLLMIVSEFNSDSQCNISTLYTTQKGKFLCDGIASDLFVV